MKLKTVLTIYYLALFGSLTLFLAYVAFGATKSLKYEAYCKEQGYKKAVIGLRWNLMGCENEPSYTPIKELNN